MDAILRREIVRKVKKHLTKAKSAKGKQAFSFDDLKKSLGYSQHRVYGLLHEWVDNGEISVIKVPTTDIIGRPSFRPQYTFVK